MDADRSWKAALFSELPILECRIPGLDLAYSLAPFLRVGGRHRFSEALLLYRSQGAVRSMGQSRPFLRLFGRMLLLALQNDKRLRRFSAVVPIPPKVDEIGLSYHLYDLADEMMALGYETTMIIKTMLRFVVVVPEVKDLPPHVRHENLKESMSSAGLDTFRGVVLIDDIIATGATMAEAARALRAMGAREIAGISLGKRVI